MDHLDRLVTQIAERHHGIFGAHHLRDLGVVAHERTYRLRTGRWIEIHDGAYRVAGTPSTWHGRVLAACWAGGIRAVASHRSAAELWALPGRDAGLVELTCPRWRRARHEHLVVHETRVLDEVDVTVRDRIPVTTPARTIFDLSAIRGDLTIDLAIDNALRRKLTTQEELEAMLSRLGRRGRPGSRRFRGVLLRRSTGPTESEAERRVLRILELHGLPTPVPQYEVRDERGRLIARVDFAYPDLKIAIEYDSYEHHMGTVAHDRDGDRRNAIIGLGWYPITATAAHLRGDGELLARDLRRARDLRSGVASRE